MKKKQPVVTVGVINPPFLASLELNEVTKKFRKFKAEKIADYENRVNQMSVADLAMHCAELGMHPNDNRRLTVASLITAFKETEKMVRRYSGNIKSAAPVPQFANSDFLDKY